MTEEERREAARDLASALEGAIRASLERDGLLRQILAAFGPDRETWIAEIGARELVPEACRIMLARGAVGAVAISGIWYAPAPDVAPLDAAMGVLRGPPARERPARR